MFFLVFFIGSCIGSFLHVVVWRSLFSTHTFYSGRSRCAHCQHILKVYDLIPLLSFCLTKGKCRYCQKKIAFSLFFSELFCGGLVALSFPNYWLCFFALGQFFFSLYDSLTKEVPAVFFLSVQFLLSISYWFLFPNFYVVSFLFLSVLFLVFFLFFRHGMGSADWLFLFFWGSFFPLEHLLLILITACLLAFPFALFKKKIAFLPFLSLSFFSFFLI